MADKDNRYFLSIIIPAYNAGKYLEKCIESLIQDVSYLYEIIIVNDGSTDNTQNIIDIFSERYNFVNCIKKKNEGVSIARNKGIEAALGEHLFFVDADDTVKEGVLQRLFDDYQETPYDFIAYSFVENWDGELKEPFFFNERFEITNGDIDKVLKKVAYNPNGRFFSHPYVRLFSSRIIQKYDIKFRQNVRLHEDQIFNLEYISRIKSFRFIKEPIYIRPMHSDSAIGSKNPKKIYYYRETINELWKLNDDLKSRGYNIEHELLVLIFHLVIDSIKVIIYTNDTISNAEKRELSNVLLKSDVFKKILCKLSLKQFSSMSEKINYCVFKYNIQQIIKIRYDIRNKFKV